MMECRHLVLLGFTCATVSTVLVVWQTGWKCSQPVLVTAPELTAAPSSSVSENRTRRHGKGKGAKKSHDHNDNDDDDDGHVESDFEQLPSMVAAVAGAEPPESSESAALQASPSLPVPAEPSVSPNGQRPPKEFAVLPGECAMRQRTKQQMHFDHVHKTNSWGSDSRITTSGTGSDQKGAYDWVYHINLFILQYNIQTVADLPCGDVAWQFSVPGINKAKAYFGGDISASVARRNAEQYTSHMNKIFRHWDLIECGVPQCCRGSSCAPFDLVITRDAIQHMTVFDGLLAVKSIVHSGAKYFAVSSYLPGTVDRKWKSLGLSSQRAPGQPMGLRREDDYIRECQTSDELKRKFCKPGQRTEETGWWYPNVMRCFPFNFPPPIVDRPSHETFKIENDHLQIYRVDDLKSVVAQYDLAAQFCRTA